MPISNDIENRQRILIFNPLTPQTVFQLDWPIYAADDQAERDTDLVVVHDGVELDDFDVQGTFLDGACLNPTVVFPTGLTGEVAFFSRRKPRTSVAVAQGRAMTAAELATAFNQDLASLRDLFDDVDIRHLKMKRRSAANSPVLVAEPEPLHAIGWDATGKRLINLDVSGAAVAGPDELITIQDFDGVGDGVADDTDPQVDAWAYSRTGGAFGDFTYDPGVEIFYPAGRYTLGGVDALIPRLRLTNGQGPVIRGSGPSSWIMRKPGYGNPGAGGHKTGGGYLLVAMEGELAIAERVILRDFSFGPDDPSHTGLFAGGNNFKVRLRDSLISGLTGLNVAGVFFLAQAENTHFHNLRNLNPHPDGGGGLRLLMPKNNLITGCKITSSDDAMFIVSKEGVTCFDGVSVIATDNVFIGNQADGLQGGSYCLLAGTKLDPLRGADQNYIVSCKLDPIFGDQRIAIKAHFHSPNVGDTVLISGATGGGGLAAADVNGVRTVLELIPDEKAYTVSCGGTVTTNAAQLGALSKVAYMRIGLTSGSTTVLLHIPNHEIDTGVSNLLSILGWNTAGLAASEVDGLRTCTGVDENTVSFEADSAATASTDIDTEFADPDMRAGFFGSHGIQRTTFAHMRGTSGDSALNAQGGGGVGRKFFNSESTVPMTVTVIDSNLRHGDSEGNAHTLMLGYQAGPEVDVYRDVVRTPSGPVIAYFCDELYGFGIAANAFFRVRDPDYEAPDKDTPTIVMDGGSLFIFGGTIDFNPNSDGIMLAESYSFPYPTGNGTRVVDAAIQGFDGAPLAIEEAVVIGVRFTGIGDGKFALRLGNIKKGFCDWCTFEQAPGATTGGAIKMRTAGVGADIGTTNFTIGRHNDYTTILAANQVVNYQSGKGNRLNDRADVPALATSAGRKGDVAMASGQLYVCVDTDTWERAAIATF